MTISLLATGDEIVHGDTLNTNAHEIAQTLCSEGLALGFHLSCSDKEQDLLDSLEFLAKRSDILILIGGLGPTTDDLTRFALAKFTQEELIQHPEALTHVQNILQRAAMKMDSGNLQQCLFPKGALILANPYGSAVGCYYSWRDKTFILLPGPPRECLPMFHQLVLPKLQQTQHSSKEILKWLIFGMAEAEIAATLEAALESLDCQTGYRLDTPYLEFKVRCRPELIAEVKRVVDPILAPHIISNVDKKASQLLRERILELKQAIYIRDEATGGLLESILMRPETAPFLNFQSPNQEGLSFHLSGLKEYWSAQPPGGTSQLRIHYCGFQQEGDESEHIPYRSALILAYAAEWLSFRLLYLINQLH